MTKAKVSNPTRSVLKTYQGKTRRTTPTIESSLLLMRLKELDREFARQTKQLTDLTKKLGKKITGLPAENDPDSN